MINQPGYLQQGFSLVEVLIATLLFSMTMIALLNYQQTLLTSVTMQQNHQQAWRIAFQQLDIYPNIEPKLLPSRWHSQLSVIKQRGSCRMIQATVIPDVGAKVELQRWFCD